MIVLNKKINRHDLKILEPHMFFEDMVKGVVDIELKLLALNAELHADIEQFLLEKGSLQKNLWGINLYFDDEEIEFDSLINIPRNRDYGYPRGGREVKDPDIRKKIEQVVEKWIDMKNG